VSAYLNILISSQPLKINAHDSTTEHRKSAGVRKISFLWWFYTSI